VTEDLLAETFLKAWRTLSNYNPSRCQGNTWLFMIARRLIIDHLRKKSRRGEMQLGQGGEASRPEELVDHHAESVDDRAEREHAALIVRKALDRLPDRYAEALDLAYLQGLDRHEIAVVLGCSVNAASSLLSRARDRLQEELDRIAR
jgi:RNA polymerase sigma-70 factor (ECF subfamily)